MTSFLAIDFETANESRDSPCAVGAVKVVDGAIVDEWETLIDPEGPFTNTWVHGISETDVRGAPLFPPVLEKLTDLATGTEVIAAHNASFDVQVLTRTAARYGLRPERVPFACTLVFSRRWFPGWPTYSLARVVDQLELAELCGDGGHHNALWDARAAAHIATVGLRQAGVTTFQEAAQALGVLLGSVTVDAYQGCAGKKMGLGSSSPIRPVRDSDAEIDPEHPLHEITVAFTGALSHLTRREAAQRVVDAGGEFAQNITQNTALLVVGQQDLKKLAGHQVSSKMRKAATMAADGHHIEIIDETDFIRLFAT